MFNDHDYRLLVCGGRDFNAWNLFKESLNPLFEKYHLNLVIIHGAARGADTFAGEYALRNQLRHMVFPAQWDTYGKRAGFMRNQTMLDEGKPHAVMAFTGGRGTNMMVDLATQHGVYVYDYR